MSVDVIRTVGDETTSAVEAIDAAIAEMANWRDHLLRIPTEVDGNPSIAHQARRSGRIVAAKVADAQRHTNRAVHSAEVRSVS